MDKFSASYASLLKRRMSSFVAIVSSLILSIISAIFFSPTSKAEIYNVFKTKETDIYVNGDTCNYYSSSQCYTRLTLIGPDGNYYTAGGDGTNSNTFVLHKIGSDGTFIDILQVPTVQGFGFGHNGNIYTNDWNVNGSHGGQKYYLKEYNTSGTLVATHDLFPAEEDVAYNCTTTPDYYYSSISSAIVMGQDSLMYVPVARIFPCDASNNFNFLMGFSSGLVLDHSVTLPQNTYRLDKSAYDIDSGGNIYVLYYSGYELDVINSAGIVTANYSLTEPTSCSTHTTPRKVLLDNLGNFYVSYDQLYNDTSATGCIQKYNSSGILVWEESATDSAWGQWIEFNSDYSKLIVSGSENEYPQGTINYPALISELTLDYDYTPPPYNPLDDFIITIKSDNAGTSNDDQFTLPVNTTFSGQYNFNVDWENDGTFDETGLTATVTHTYPSPGTYTIRISGDFPAIKFGYTSDRLKILSVDQWGTGQWMSMDSAFYYASNMEVLATDTPDVSLVTNFYATFYRNTKFDSDLSSWDISNATQMSNMLYQTSLSIENYDATLDAWSQLSLRNGVSLDARYSYYCNSELQRQSIIDTYGWTINDGGKWCDPVDAEYYHAVDYGGSYARLELKYGHEDQGGTISVSNIPVGYSFGGTSGMAYDPTDCQVYVLIKLNNDGDGSWQNFFLATLDLATKEATIIGDTGEAVSNMFFDESGNLYGVTGGLDAPGNIHSFVAIDKATGIATLIQQLGEGSIGSDNYGHTIAYNPQEGIARYLHGYVADRVYQSINLDGNSLTDLTYTEDTTTPSEAPTVMYFDIDNTNQFIMIDWSENAYNIDTNGNETFKTSFPGGSVNDVKGLIPWTCPFIEEPTPTPTPTLTITATPTPTLTVTPSVTTTITSTPLPTATDTPFPTFITGTPINTVEPTIETRNNNFCPRFISIKAEKGLIKLTELQTITWSTENAAGVLLDDYELPAKGSITFSIDTNSPVQLTAYNDSCDINEFAPYSVVSFYPDEVLPLAAGTVLIGEVIFLQLAALYGGASTRGAAVYGSTMANLGLMLAGILKSKKKKPWGVVFDSKTGKPISRAILRLYEKDGKTLVETVVSDAYGIFTLKPQKGSYILKASHPKYSFPSKADASALALRYANPYMGEEITVTKDHKQVGFSVPMDLTSSNKSGMLKLKLQSIFEKATFGVSTSLLLAGLIYSLYVLYLLPTSTNYIVAVAYFVLTGFKLYSVFVGPKTEGKVIDKVSGKAIQGLELGLFDSEYNNLIYRTFTTDQGTYSFAVGEGKYQLKILNDEYELLKGKTVVQQIDVTEKDINEGHIVALDIEAKRK